MQAVGATTTNAEGKLTFQPHCHSAEAVYKSVRSYLLTKIKNNNSTQPGRLTLTSVEQSEAERVPSQSN